MFLDSRQSRTSGDDGTYSWSAAFVDDRTNEVGDDTCLIFKSSVNMYDYKLTYCIAASVVMRLVAVTSTDDVLQENQVFY